MHKQPLVTPLVNSAPVKVRHVGGYVGSRVCHAISRLLCVTSACWEGFGSCMNNAQCLKSCFQFFKFLCRHPPRPPPTRPPPLYDPPVILLLQAEKNYQKRRDCLQAITLIEYTASFRRPPLQAHIWICYPVFSNSTQITTYLRLEDEMSVYITSMGASHNSIKLYHIQQLVAKWISLLN